MSPLDFLSRVIDWFRASFTRRFPNLNLVTWSWFAEACLTHAIRRNHAEAFLTSCKGLQSSRGLIRIVIQPMPPRLLVLASRLLPPRGPRRQTGTGTAEAAPATPQEQQTPRV